jgi:uncharacterized protein (DUF302 family)
MADYTLSTEVAMPYDEAVLAVRDALGEQGFGILTEIDLKQTLKDKLDVEVAPQVILGACRPPLAFQAIQADPSIAAVLPCNVVVRSSDEATTVVEAFDPHAMLGFSEAESLREVAEDARERLEAALAMLADHA